VSPDRWLAPALRSIADAVLATDERGAVTFLNAKAEELLGVAFAEVVGAPSCKVFRLVDEGSGAPLPDPVARVLATGEAIAIEAPAALVMQAAALASFAPLAPSPAFAVEGTVSPIRDGATSGAVALFRDVRPARRAARERGSLALKMFEAQKLESLGVLAGGIAHDFNNLLTVVLGNVALARADEAGKASTAESLVEIEVAARKAAELCQQMLAYAGKASLIESEFDLSALARESAELLRASVSDKAELRLELGSDLPRVHADRAQLQQVLVNLVVNASEAIAVGAVGAVGAAGVGTITVRTGLAQPTDEDLRAAAVAPSSLDPVEYVSLEIHDTGAGLDPSSLRRVFEPFFSTKFAGRGLGLAAVAGITRRHRGLLTVTSSFGRGTSFTVLLPATGGSQRRSSRRLPVASPVAIPSGVLANALEAGVVLVVDDEAGVVRVARRLLGALGLETIAAGDGREALERLAVDRARERRICLVLLDVTMPGLDGVETLGRLRAENPSLPVLLTSGHSAASTELRVRFDEKTRFLQKPFTVADLREALDALLR
jgi:signal transduction histidine kinase/CheY-like chemotaxis protein